jgi:Amidases related to nicotinamidase
VEVLVVIDMQKDFIDGSLGTKEAQLILPKIIKRVEKSKKELILFTYDTHQENYLDTLEGKKLPIVHCIEGSEGWEFDKDIINAWKNNEDTILLDEIEKHYFYKPVFGSMELVKFLKKHAVEITKVELIGVCTDICVVSNAIMIKNEIPDLELFVAADLCAGVTLESHEAALKVLAMCQVNIT